MKGFNRVVRGLIRPASWQYAAFLGHANWTIYYLAASGAAPRCTMSLPPLTPSQQIKPRHFELRISVLFAALFLPAGIHLPYFPLWLEKSGFDAAAIALILSAPMFLRVVTTPFITALADRVSDRVHVLIVIVAASLLFSFGYFAPSSFGWVLGVSLILAVVWTPHAPLTDSLALSGVRRFGSDYSRMRIWGSISFLAANLAGGALLTAVGVSVLPALLSLGLALTLVAAIYAPRLGRPRLASPLSVAQLQERAPALLTPAFVWFVTGAGLVTASHGFNYGFSSIYWASLGIAESTIGLLWACGVLAEVGMFLAFTRVFGRTSPTVVLLVGGTGAVLRWTMFPLVWPAGFGVPGFFVVQSLHAVSTGLVLLGVQKMIAETVPDHRFGAAQGIAFFANGFAMAAVTLASGSLYERLGADAYFAMSAVATLGVLCLVAASRSAPKLRGGR